MGFINLPRSAQATFKTCFDLQGDRTKVISAAVGSFMLTYVMLSSVSFSTWTEITFLKTTHVYFYWKFMIVCLAIPYPNVRLLQSDADTVCNISVLLFCRMLLFKFSVHNFPTSPFSLNTTNPSELYLFRCGVTTMAFVTLVVLWARLTAKRILMSRLWNRSKCNGQ